MQASYTWWLIVDWQTEENEAKIHRISIGIHKNAAHKIIAYIFKFLLFSREAAGWDVVEVVFLHPKNSPLAINIYTYIAIIHSGLFARAQIHRHNVHSIKMFRSLLLCTRT